VIAATQVRRLATLAIGTFVAGYLAICAALFFFQTELSFPTDGAEVAVADGSERITVPNGTFFHWRPVRGGGRVVVHFHSNGDQVSYLSSLAQQYARVGVSFAAVEYPGYPGASGQPSEASIIAAAEAALVHLTGALQIDRSRIVISGQSFGTGVALEMAARGWGSQLVLVSPYTSWPEVVGHAMPWLPTGLLIRDRFDASLTTPRVTVPTLVIHGTRDSIVPFSHGQAIAAAIPGAQLLAVIGGHHHDVLEWGTSLSQMLQFVAR
jgi:pimeloyl-ACP methyl ester carboxylesterase